MSSRMKCCGLGLFKYFFHVFNVLFLISGLAVFAVGIWGVFLKSHYVHIHSTITYPFIVHVMLAVGILVTAINVVGYVGVWKENRCTILYYMFLLFFVFIVEVSIGILSSFYQDKVLEELNRTLNVTFTNAYGISDKETDSIDYIQQTLRCCGALRFEDWVHSEWYSKSVTKNVLVPPSCCKSPSLNCGKSTNPSNIYYDGCADPLAMELIRYLGLIKCAAFFIGFLQIFGVILTFILFLKVRSPY